MDIEVLRKTSSDEERKRNQAAKDIKMAYLNNKYFFGSNSPASKDGQHKVVLIDFSDTNDIDILCIFYFLVMLIIVDSGV